MPEEETHEPSQRAKVEAIIKGMVADRSTAIAVLAVLLNPAIERPRDIREAVKLAREFLTVAMETMVP